MDIELTSSIYKNLKEYLTNNSQYSPNVVRKSLKQTNKFPLVVLTEENSYTSSGTLKFKQREIVDTIYWEVNIYATDMNIDNKTISNAEICDELKSLVDDVMSKVYKLTRLSCRPTPNLDDTIYRITMRYTTDLLVNKKRII